MNIQNINSNNISNKGIYYTKSAPMISKRLDFDPSVRYNISKLGAKYIEDNSLNLNQNMKKHIAKNPIVVKLSQKMDIFVQYFGEKWNDSFKTYESRLRLYLLKEENGEKELKIFDFAENDPRSSLSARAKLFSSL